MFVFVEQPAESVSTADRGADRGPAWTSGLAAGRKGLAFEIPRCGVVVLLVLAQGVYEMDLVPDQHPVEQLVAAALDPPSTVSAFCISHTFPVVLVSDHLCPFALWTALPSSLAGCDSGDYYGHCVAIGLAPRRRSHVRP
jgi:hypothetical protein